MELSVYEIEDEQEQTHWWFVGRRRLFRTFIEKYVFDKNAKILDVGSSTGTNLRLLQEIGFNQIVGLDPNINSQEFCAKKGLDYVRVGDINSAPFESGTFDFLLATDILEHVDEDKAALKEIYRILKPGGFALITVPAFLSLWGAQDELAHHKRRYLIGQLLELTQEAGFFCKKKFYFNFILCPFIYVARKIIKILNIRLGSEAEVNSAWLNKVLKFIFLIDVKTAPYLNPPFGVSIFMLLEKPKDI